MKKILFAVLFVLCISIGSITCATEIESGNDINSMTLEQYLIMMQSRQGKVDIIKKNNIQIETLKEELKGKIVVAAEKINALKLDISEDKVVITDETLEELKNLLQFLQTSKETLEEDVEKTSAEINEILDLISTRGLQLEQYDQLIEKQNEVIVKMKEVMATVEKI